MEAETITKTHFLSSNNALKGSKGYYNIIQLILCYGTTKI